MLELFQRIRHANVTLQGKLEFANDWNFFMADPSGDCENLISTGPHAGTLEAFATGVKLRTRYKDLLDQAIASDRTTFWASDSRRVIETAQYFGAGFFGIAWERIARLHVIPETADRAANTLAPGRTCAEYNRRGNGFGHDLGVQKLQEWRSVYLPPIIERLAKEHPELRFTDSEIYSMQELCGFELMAKGSSPWCEVFTHAEWEDFEYARDLLHFYRSGPGNPYGAAMGWLWLNATTELLSVGPAAGPLFLSL